MASRGTFDEDLIVSATGVQRTGPHSIGYSAVCSSILMPDFLKFRLRKVSLGIPRQEGGQNMQNGG